VQGDGLGAISGRLSATSRLAMVASVPAAFASLEQPAKFAAPGPMTKNYKLGLFIVFFPTKPFSPLSLIEGVQMKRSFAVKLAVVSQAHTCSEQPPPAQVSLQPPRNIGIALDMATQLCGRNFSPGGVSFKSEI
jgi:hypothetical protein